MKDFKSGEVEYDLKGTFSMRLVNAAGSQFFSSVYVKIIKTGQLINVCVDGLFSCHVFTSNFLKMHDLIEVPCANIDSLEKGLIDAGWRLYWRDGINEVEELVPLSVLIWEPRLGSDGEMHKHSGFYIANSICISNDPRIDEEGSLKCPITHQIDLSDIYPKNKKPRKLEKAYFHDSLR